MAKPHKTSKRALNAAERRRMAMNLRLAGKSFQAIGDHLGISRQRAHRLIADELARLVEETQDDAAAYRQLHVERIEAMLAAAWPLILGRDDGKAVGATTRLSAIEKAVRLLDRQAKLLGLDKPTPMELSGPGGGALPIGFAEAADAVYGDAPDAPGVDASEG